MSPSSRLTQLGTGRQGQLAFGKALDCPYEILTENGFALAGAQVARLSLKGSSAVSTKGGDKRRAISLS